MFVYTIEIVAEIVYTMRVVAEIVFTFHDYKRLLVKWVIAEVVCVLTYTCWAKLLFLIKDVRIC